MENMINLPFNYELTPYCIKNFVWIFDWPLSGFNLDDNTFFKTGVDEHTNSIVRHEYEILLKLQEYDFIPKVISLKEMNQHLVLSMERLNAISLDNISMNDPRFEIGIRGALKIIHQLYKDKKFLHRDMHPNNIMVDRNNKVYLIDFAFEGLLLFRSKPAK